MVKGKPIRRTSVLRRDHSKRLALRSQEEVVKMRIKMHPSGKKKCSVCQKRLHFDKFSKSASAKNGLRSQCRRCASIGNLNLRQRYKAQTDKDIKKQQQKLRPNGKKMCLTCEIERPLSDFAIARNRPDGLQDFCKPCAIKKKIQCKTKLDNIRNEKRVLGCVFCSENDVRCIDLAHFDRTAKLRNKSGKVVQPCQIQSKSLLEKELKLVQPICSNCHSDQTEDEDKILYQNGKQTNIFLEKIASRRRIIKNEKIKRGCCVDCKLPVDDRLRKFDFDHVRGERIWHISDMAVRVHLYTDQQIVDEMAKCDLRCKNCHRKITALRISVKNNSMSQPVSTSHQLSAARSS